MLAKQLISRANLLRNFNGVAKKSIRLSSEGVWSYRVPPPSPPKKNIFLAECLGGIVWWWILYHCVTEPEHIYGEFPYIDPSTYCDEELGIPPDSVGSLRKK